MWAASSRRPAGAPGAYQVRVTADGQTETQPFAIKREPHVLKERQRSDLREEFDLAIKVRDKASQPRGGAAGPRHQAQIGERKSKLTRSLRRLQRR